MITIDNITLGQYQALYSIQKSDMDDIDKMAESVALLAGKTLRQLDDMPVPEYMSITRSLRIIWESASVKDEPLKKILESNGRSYGLEFEPGKLSTGQYIEVQKWMQGDVVENAHLLLASISYNIVKGKHVKRDPDKFNEVSTDFQDMIFMDVYPSILFFCHVFDASIVALVTYLEKEVKKTSKTKMTNEQKIENIQREMMLTSLRTTMAGYTQRNSLQTTTT